MRGLSVSEKPFILFYTSDFLAGTSGMTAATKGVYITLLSLMYEAEAPLPQSWETLARRCGCTKSSFKKAVEALEDDAKITITEAGLWSEKCDKHIALRRERSVSAKAAAKKRWEKTQQKQGKGDAPAPSTQCYPEPEPYTVTKVTDADAPPDPAKIVWDSGVKILKAAGKSDGQSRAIVGKWRKDYADAQIIEALGACQREGAVEPVSYITAALKPKDGAKSFRERDEEVRREAASEWI